MASKKQLQPILIDGQKFVPTREAEAVLAISKVTLLSWARRDMTNNIVITLPNGLRFIRYPRFVGDQKAPLFWTIENVTRPALLRGFAAMPQDERRIAASKGGRQAQLNGTAHRFSSIEEARWAGKKGGRKVSENRERMRELRRQTRLRHQNEKP